MLVDMSPNAWGNEQLMVDEGCNTSVCENGFNKPLMPERKGVVSLLNKIGWAIIGDCLMLNSINSLAVYLIKLQINVCKHKGRICR